jgi:hypothetical protein
MPKLTPSSVHPHPPSSAAGGGTVTPPAAPPPEIDRLEFVLNSALAGLPGPRLDQVRAILTDHLTDLKREAAAKAQRQQQLAERAHAGGFPSTDAMLKADAEKNARLEQEAEELGFGSAALMQRAGPEALAAARARKRGYRNVAEMQTADKRTAR